VSGNWLEIASHSQSIDWLFRDKVKRWVHRWTLLNLKGWTILSLNLFSILTILIFFDRSDLNRLWVADFVIGNQSCCIFGKHQGKPHTLLFKTENIIFSQWFLVARFDCLPDHLNFRVGCFRSSIRWCSFQWICYSCLNSFLLLSIDFVPFKSVRVILNELFRLFSQFFWRQQGRHRRASDYIGIQQRGFLHIFLKLIHLLKRLILLAAAFLFLDYLRRRLLLDFLNNSLK